MPGHTLCLDNTLKDTTPRLMAAEKAETTQTEHADQSGRCFVASARIPRYAGRSARKLSEIDIITKPAGWSSVICTGVDVLQEDRTGVGGTRHFSEQSMCVHGVGGGVDDGLVQTIIRALNQPGGYRRRQPAGSGDAGPDSIDEKRIEESKGSKGRHGHLSMIEMLPNVDQKQKDSSKSKYTIPMRANKKCQKPIPILSILQQDENRWMAATGIWTLLRLDESSISNQACRALASWL
ncbi:hypothetical protein V8F20_005007 [Naviculisporaceae sp. PSN 640]